MQGAYAQGKSTCGSTQEMNGIKGEKSYDVEVKQGIGNVTCARNRRKGEKVIKDQNETGDKSEGKCMR